MTMSKVKQIIELLDTDRIGNDVVFNYITPEMEEDQPVIKVGVTEDELIEYILDFELADHNDLAALLLNDAFEEVTERYWSDMLHPRLTQNYLDAMVYMQSFIAKCHKPLSKADTDLLRKNMVAQFGVQFGKEAA